MFFHLDLCQGVPWTVSTRLSDAESLRTIATHHHRRGSASAATGGEGPAAGTCTVLGGVRCLVVSGGAGAIGEKAVLMCCNKSATFSVSIFSLQWFSCNVLSLSFFSLRCLSLSQSRDSLVGVGWVILKIPRGDIDGVGEDEVTETSGLHAQAERTNRQTEERGLHPVEA